MKATLGNEDDHSLNRFSCDGYLPQWKYLLKFGLQSNTFLIILMYCYQHQRLSSLQLFSVNCCCAKPLFTRYLISGCNCCHSWIWGFDKCEKNWGCQDQLQFTGWQTIVTKYMIILGWQTYNLILCCQADRRVELLAFDHSRQQRAETCLPRAAAGDSPLKYPPNHRFIVTRFCKGSWLLEGKTCLVFNSFLVTYGIRWRNYNQLL